MWFFYPFKRVEVFSTNDRNKWKSEDIGSGAWTPQRNSNNFCRVRKNTWGENAGFFSNLNSISFFWVGWRWFIPLEFFLNSPDVWFFVILKNIPCRRWDVHMRAFHVDSKKKLMRSFQIRESLPSEIHFMIPPSSVFGNL